MQISEKNIQKVSDRVHTLRQHWRQRVQISHVVHPVASSVFFLLSVVYSYSLLPLLLPEELQAQSLGFLDYFGHAWHFLQNLFSVPEKPVLSVFTVFFALYGISFLAAAVAAVIAACKCKKEPKPKVKGLKHSQVSSMVTGIKIYQERISVWENVNGTLNSILSLAFSLILTGMVAYAFAHHGLFEAHWEAFLGWAIFGTAASWVAHRLLLGGLRFPVALLYCFGAPAPGLRKALEKKAEEIKPKYKYVDQPKPYVPKSDQPAVWGSEDYARINARANEILHGRNGSLSSAEKLSYINNKCHGVWSGSSIETIENDPNLTPSQKEEMKTALRIYGD